MDLCFFKDDERINKIVEPNNAQGSENDYSIKNSGHLQSVPSNITFNNSGDDGKWNGAQKYFKSIFEA